MWNEGGGYTNGMKTETTDIVRTSSSPHFFSEVLNVLMYHSANHLMQGGRAPNLRTYMVYSIPFQALLELTTGEN